MAHPFFEGLGVSLDGQQTALAVQSLLDPQTTSVEQQPATDDGDIFQCGRCKKQFTQLPDFLSHKDKCKPSTPAVPKAVRPLQTFGGQPSAFTATLPHIIGKSQAINPGSVAPVSLPQNLVFSEDLMTLSSVDNSSLNLQPQQYNITFQNGNPILSQVASPQISSQQQSVSGSVSAGPTFSGAVASSLASSNSAFTSTIQSTALTGLTHALKQEQGIIEINSDHVAKSESVVQSFSQATELPLETISTIQLVPSQDTGQTVHGQPLEGISNSSSAMGTMGLTPVEGLTLAGGLQLQQIQLGSQAQPVVLASGLNTADCNIIQGVSIIKPNVTKIVEAKKEGYTFLQPQELQLITSNTGEPTLDIQLESLTKPTKAREKVDKVQQEEGGPKKKLKCTYCEKLFSKNFDLHQHIRSHTGEKPFQCIVCGRAFAQKSNVKKHMQTHKVWPKASQTLPAEPILTFNNVNNSLNAVQETENSQPNSEFQETSKFDDSQLVFIDNSYHCQYCQMKFNTYFKLKSHLVIHKAEQVYKCIHEKCSEMFKELDGYLEHIKTHEADMEYKCHICSKKFPTLCELGLHQYSHSLYPNQGTKAGGSKYYKCSLCGNKYTSTVALKHHLDTSDHKFPCPKCKKTFHCERALRRHIATHNESNDFHCTVCGKGFKTEQYVKLHMQNHNQDTPFNCEVCGAAFNRKDKLKRHLIIHEPNKKYKCPFRNHTGCDKAFNRADKLKSHIISHSGIKPFKCRYCGKAFSRRPHLNEHIRVHEGNYRFHCSGCRKGFNRKNLFAIHKCRCSGKDGDKTESETETSKLNSPVKRRFFTRKIKRRPGRPRKTMNLNEITETLNRVKRPVGRPKKLLPSASVKSPEINRETSPRPKGIEFQDVQVGDESGGKIILVNTDDSAEAMSDQVKSFSEVQNMGEVAQDGSTVLHVQLVTDQEGPMLAHGLGQITLKSDNVHNVEMINSNPGAINISGSLTQEHLQEIFLSGNAHNVKLMEVDNGETFVIDEATQQVIAQIASSSTKTDMNRTVDDDSYQPVNESVLSIDASTADETTITSVPISSEGGEEGAFVDYVAEASVNEDGGKTIVKL